MRHQVNKRRASISRILLNITSDAIPTSRPSHSSLHRPKLSRKDARKQSRDGKKRRKAEYFLSTGTNPKRLATSPHPESPPPKRRTPLRPQSSGLPSEKSRFEYSSGLASKNTRTVVSSREPSSHFETDITLPTLPRTQQEEEEDRYISLLEEKLTSGRKSKNGLGYLRDIVDDGLGGG